LATVRRRAWRSNGEVRSSWVADYFDQTGKRRLKTFPTKKAADAWLVTARHQVATGVHTPESASITLAQAAAMWLERGEAEGLERSTLDKYRAHVRMHINPVLGATKLARLTAPAIEHFRDDLLGRLSRPMAKKVLGSLKAILADAQRRGCTAQNPAAVVRIRTKSRDERKAAVGTDIPTKAEVNAILAAAEGRWRPLFITAALTGLRASELRGLRWADVDLDAKLIHVRQRADQWSVIGPPKSKAGHRSVPMTPMILAALREWRLACPRRQSEGRQSEDSQPGQLWLVFPNGAGNPESHANIVNRGFGPVQVAAGVTDAAGKPKYGLHALRHFFASWAIERGFSAKKLQALLGHSSIQMTFDTYGHLFPSLEDDHAKFAEGEQALVAGK
jgi:integrase